MQVKMPWAHVIRGSVLECGVRERRFRQFHIIRTANSRCLPFPRYTSSALSTAPLSALITIAAYLAR